jgi:hypothetical protein
MLVVQRLEKSEEHLVHYGRQHPQENTYIHTYHSRFIPEGVAESSQIFLQDTHVSPKLVSYEEHRRRNKW